MAFDRGQITELGLVNALAEDLKQPLLRIAYKAELATATGNSQALADIVVASRSAMQLIDTMLLGFRSLYGQLHLELSPLAPSAVLQDVESILAAHSKMSGCLLEVETKGKQQLAMINQPALIAALVSLGQVLIDQQAGLSNHPRMRIVAYKSGGSPRIGMFVPKTDAVLVRALLPQARRLRQAGQAASILSVNNSGVFIAEQLIEAQQAQLTQANLDGWVGISARLVPSQQLALV